MDCNLIWGNDVETKEMSEFSKLQAKLNLSWNVVGGLEFVVIQGFGRWKGKKQKKYTKGNGDHV